MENSTTINPLITGSVILATVSKIDQVPLGHYSRLKVDGYISDIVILTSSSGVWFYDVPGTIQHKMGDKIIQFISYQDLEDLQEETLYDLIHN